MTEEVPVLSELSEAYRILQQYDAYFATYANQSGFADPSRLREVVPVAGRWIGACETALAKARKWVRTTSSLRNIPESEIPRLVKAWPWPAETFDPEVDTPFDELYPEAPPTFEQMPPEHLKYYTNGNTGAALTKQQYDEIWAPRRAQILMEQEAWRERREAHMQLSGGMKPSVAFKMLADVIKRVKAEFERLKPLCER